MTVKGASPPVDRRLAALARRQYGVVTRRQLLRIGVGEQGILERVRSERLHRIHRGVYSVGHDVLRGEAHWLAGVLACGPGAVLSHRSAAALWEVRPDSSTTVDVTVPSQNGRRRRPGVRVHRSRRLAPADVTTCLGIPVTTVARTLLDLADVVPRQVLKRAIDQAEYRQVFDLTSVRAVVDNNPGRRGARVLELAQGPPELTRSELERRFLAMVERHGLPRPRVGVDLEGYLADFVWPEARLIVETDGLGAHGSRAAMERDRARDRRLLLAGYQTVRLTARALVREETTIARQLRALLAQGGERTVIVWASGGSPSEGSPTPPPRPTLATRDEALYHFAPASPSRARSKKARNPRR